MNLNSLAPKVSKKDRKRKGQGSGSGNGTYAGRGCNGQNSRAGGGVRLGFEGGQSGLLDRLPKLRGFTNPNRVETQVVNLEKIEAFYKDGETISVVTLIEKNLMNKNNAKVKVLGNGELTKKVTVSSEVLVSASAAKAITKAGGAVAKSE